MPHLILEFSSNIIEKNNLSELFKTCHIILANELPADLGSCKSRSLESNAYYIGDGRATNAFVHISVKVKPGRSEEALQRVAGKLMAVFQSYFTASLKSLNLQITLEILELQNIYFSIKTEA